MSMSELARLARGAILKSVHDEGVAGLIGKGDDETTYYTDPQGTTYKDHVWVRIGNPSSTTTVVARNTRVPAEYDMPVIVAERHGGMEVIRADYARAAERTGHQVAEVGPHAHTHSRFGSDPLYIEGMQVIPLMTRPQNPADMTVYVSPGFYRHLGTEKVWEGGNTNDLSSYIPSTHSNSAFVNHYFIIICLDRSNNEIVVVDGSSKTTTNYRVPFDAADCAAIDIDDDYHSLSAIHLHQNHTAIVTRDIFMDMRFWGGERIGPDQIPGHNHWGDIVAMVIALGG